MYCDPNVLIHVTPNKRVQHAVAQPEDWFVPPFSPVSLLKQQMEGRSLWIGLTMMTASLTPTRPPGPQSSSSPAWLAPAGSPTFCTWSNRAGIWAIGRWSWTGPSTGFRPVLGTKSGNWATQSTLPGLYSFICDSHSVRIFSSIQHKASLNRQGNIDWGAKRRVAATWLYPFLCDGCKICGVIPGDALK